MKVVPVDVFMLEDDIRLVAVTHTLHILPGDFLELYVGQSVFRRRIQRSMENRIGRSSVSFEVRSETLHASVDIHSSVFVEGF